MKYCIITEKKVIYKAEKVILGKTIITTFVDIEEEDKHYELEYAAMFRFGKSYIIEDSIALSLKNETLTLIPQADYYNGVDIPTLSLMA